MRTTRPASPHLSSPPTLAALWWAPAPPGTSSSPDASSIWGCRQRCGLQRTGRPSLWYPAGRRWCLKILHRRFCSNTRTTDGMLLQHQNNKTLKVSLQLKIARNWKLTSGVDGPVLEVARVRSDAKLACVLHHKPISQTSSMSSTWKELLLPCPLVSARSRQQRTVASWCPRRSGRRKSARTRSEEEPE